MESRSLPGCPLAQELATRLRAARRDITERWLERIASRVTLDANRLFPSDELLDHVPVLVEGIAAFVEDPAADVATEPPVIAKAMELGELRYQQGFDAYEIFKEYEILGSVLFHYLASVADEIDRPCTREQLLYCGQRVFQAVTLIQQATAMQFLRQTQGRIRDREDRLRGFNRMVSHELKNRVGAASGAVDLLSEGWLDERQRDQFLGMASTNLAAIRNVLDDLAALSRLDEDLRQQRNVRLPEAVAEVSRRLRDFARVHDVSIEVEEPLPPVEVNAAAVELSLTNYISNAVKYSDPTKPRRWVCVRARLADRERDGRTGKELVVEVSDNGVGIPEDARANLFKRFFRAHKDSLRDVEGTGLGLSIVRETLDDLGGRTWVESTPGEGSVFSFALPADRSSEARETSPIRQLAGDGVELRP
ncbi:MAG TPA: sensor histidine kinase [Acidobacteriaceae bacterium]|nr:sensor histidine kinase [Acidobacteriaceae bacterium]